MRRRFGAALLSVLCVAVLVAPLQASASAPAGYADSVDRALQTLRLGPADDPQVARQAASELEAGTGDVQVVDVRNDGALPDLPDDAVVEIPARIDRDGAHVLPLAPLAPEMLGLVQGAKAYERLAVLAATSGDRSVALKALLANQLVGDYGVATGLLEALLDGNRPELPRFFPEG